LSSNKVKAEKDYMRGMKYKDLAEKYGVTLNTIKSWKTRYGWDRKGVHTKKSVHTNKVGAPIGSKNALGNRGGHGGPAQNDKAVKHGLFRKYLPDDEETRQIYDEAGQTSSIDLLWSQIQIKFTAIIRAQKIMWVRDQEDMTKILKRQKESSGLQSDSWEREYELQHAWDKQASFLNAQARAMSTLTSMIRQYEEMCRLGWADEEQRLRIEKLKAEVKALSSITGEEGVKIIDDIGSGPDGG
jgi:YD repeat-containing protein